MRSVIPIATLFSGALALWNPKICNGAGGCVQGTYNPPDPFRCPDGTTLNIQQTASNSLASDGGAYDIVSKAEFPTSCLNGAQPGNTDTLAVHTTEFGQKMYLFVKPTCTDSKPADPGNCYSANPNPSSSTVCQLFDSKGQKCIGNPRAGLCERWGGSTVRPQCIGWKIGQPDLPRDD